MVQPTRMDDRIKMMGELLVLHRNTGSVENNYGDKTPIWGVVSLSETEYIWVQDPKPDPYAYGVPGRLDVDLKVGLFMSYTEALELDKVLSTPNYRIERLRLIKRNGGETSHYEASLRKMEES